MSLKAFHIAFITLCSLLTLFVAGWAFLTVAGSTGIIAGVSSLLVGVLLIVYARKFKRKMQDTIYQT